MARALDEAGRNEAVKPSGHRAWGAHDAFAQLGHPESITGARQAEKDVVVGQGQLVRPPEVGVEAAGHVLMGVEEGLPGPELFVAQPGHHCGSLCETACMCKHLRRMLPVASIGDMT